MNLGDHQLLGYCSLLKSDLDEVLSKNQHALEQLRGKDVLIMGGTGFVGKWLLGSLLHARHNLDLKFNLCVITRDERKARTSIGLTNEFGIDFVQHDLSNGAFKFSNKFDVLIHGATPSVPTTGSLDIDNVRNATVFAAETIINACHSGSRIINLSSGAVFGKPRETLSLIPESSLLGAPANTYAQAKVEAEKVFDKFQLISNVNVSHARLFAFAGPYISLSQHFAIGNFVNNIIEGSPIIVKGNPNTRRSYLYPTDLTGAVIRLITETDIKSLNIGSDQSYSMLELASVCARISINKEIITPTDVLPMNSYIPEIKQMRGLLQDVELVSLTDSIGRWIKWIGLTGIRY